MVVLCIGDGHLRHGDRRNAVRLRALDQIVTRARALHATDELVAIVVFACIAFVLGVFTGYSAAAVLR
jgi:hypothetical protein